MSVVVVAGGTDGIGRAVALQRLAAGHTVVLVGRDPVKADAVRAQAFQLGAGERLHFVHADLSLLRETSRAVEHIRTAYPSVDAVVLCARHYHSRRSVTTEGVEENFALFYLSRYLISHGLVPAMRRAPRAVVVNVAGPGAELSVVRWDDLELRRDYHGGAALGQGGKLNDLLGVAFTDQHGPAGPRYVLIHPGVTATGFSGTYDTATLPHIRAMQQNAKPVSAVLPPILAALDDPPADPLSAFVEGVRLRVDTAGFDPRAARRLDELTRKRLAALHLDLHEDLGDS
ncbi:SDR family NAD(P)-dependent oxidoreductase [Micromonospora sp. NPDC048905]|uniref:SDR family NAD(P)-dependent oxidoreductase n=1 Tax=unclassified Micromonospora TaxID=2617518 RepID=UPI00340260F9